MPVVEQMSLERAYRVVGVPTDASAQAIKQVHRKLVRRWHPDLHGAGTAEHSEASEMTRLINEAYSAISNAPLRYQPPPVGVDYRRNATQDSKPGSNANETSEKPLPRLDRIEFWVRFVCGALFGAFVTLDVFIGGFTDSVESPKTLMIGVFGTLTIGLGILSTWLGDKFWYMILGRWFRWIF